MSLLVTSNTPENLNSGYNQEGLNKSYSYQNNLNDTFKIPANSEIAVQSVKINRSGNIDLNESNSIYSFYFGEEITEYTGKQRDVLSIPWSTSFAIDPEELFQGTGTEDVVLDGNLIRRFSGNVDNIARMMKASLNRTLWHPNLMQNASTGRNAGASVTPLRNGSGIDWLGWDIKVTNTDSSKNETNKSASWMGQFYNGTDDGDDYTWDAGLSKLTCPALNDRSCVGIDYPISLANGSFSVTINASSSYHRIGLCRALEDEPPSYFDDNNGDNFYDYVVEITDGGDISVEFAGSDEQGELTMIPFDYGAVKNASTDKIQKIHFNIQNEKVKISLEDDKAAVTVLCDGSSVNSASNVKPISMTCRYLYPKIDLVAGKHIIINEFQGVDITNHDYYGFTGTSVTQEIPTYTDYWAHVFLSNKYGNGAPNLGSALLQAKEIDTEFKKNINRINQLGLNGNGQCDYKVSFFFAPDVRYYNTARCNTQFLMGFPNRSLVNIPTSTAVASPYTLTFQSDSQPELKGTQSLFIRIKNMTFSSVNLAKGANSKILYHVPAFANTGTRVGALFFEPNERVYLKLNNTTDLFLSTVEIDVVYADETLATDLQGKTTVVLHVRDA
tara:strand:+ start:266 stop:2107 length:1842 start_codon:yes stop_codon:yes gene_type:complete